MRNLQRVCATLSLALALSITAMAGDVHTGKPMISSPPTPPQTYEEGSSSTTGAISEVNDATSVDPLAELTLALLNGVLSIF